LSLFLLLIDLRPQRIESHSLKTPLSCATDSKSHRENTYRKRPEKHFQRRKLFCNRDRKSQQQEHGTQKHTHEREREREGRKKNKKRRAIRRGGQFRNRMDLLSWIPNVTVIWNAYLNSLEHIPHSIIVTLLASNSASVPANPLRLGPPHVSFRC
jgi:hypothetical protein